MAIANPRIHIICGICGCNKEFEYYIDRSINYDESDEGIEETKVYISCQNCGSLTSFDELMKEVEK